MLGRLRRHQSDLLTTHTQLATRYTSCKVAAVVRIRLVASAAAAISISSFVTASRTADSKCCTFDLVLYELEATVM